MSDNHQMLTATKAAALILESAAESCLPEPDGVHVVHAGVVEFQMRNVDDFAEWVNWRSDLTCSSRNTVGNDGYILHADGSIFDHPVKVYAVAYYPQLVTA